MHDVSWAVCPVSPLRREGLLETGRSVATGFLWQTPGGWFLITNWHNVTGLNPDTGQPIGSFAPTAIEISLKVVVSKAGETTMVKSVPVVVDLYRDDQPIWLEHPSRHKVDCVAIPLGNSMPDSLANKALNASDFVTDYQPSVGDDCFVIGYPHGLAGRGRTPVWKRASVATEPEFDHDQQPLLLVDTATRQGMSGSPVIVRHSGIYMRDGLTMGDDDIFGTVENFLGVYSGRVGDDPLGVQLGRVWKGRVVSEIIAANLWGLHPLDVRT